MKFHVRFKTEEEYRWMKELINLAITDFNVLALLATNPVAGIIVNLPQDLFLVWRNYEGWFSVLKINPEYLSIGAVFSIRVDGII